MISMAFDARLQQLDGINGHPLKSQPGTDFADCNANYALLTLVVEVVNHTTSAEDMKAHIFQPLGMTAAANGTQYSQANGSAKTMHHNITAWIYIPRQSRKPMNSFEG